MGGSEGGFQGVQDKEVVVDTRGSRCPQPFVEMIKAFARIGWKGRVKLLTSDKRCRDMVVELGGSLGIRMVGEAQEGEIYIIIAEMGGS